MTNKAKRKVRETFKASVFLGNNGEGPYYLDIVMPVMKRTDWHDGDKVRVTVELLERRKRKGGKCPSCGGSGYAPYVGGDDDDARCTDCKGSGFVRRKRRI